jgi:type 1 glutamine amidotransferase
MTNALSRRRFLGNLVRAGTGLTILTGSASARAYAANEKLNIALVGCGTRGRHFVEAIPRIGENLVAMCDVNEQRAARAFQMAPEVSKYYDYRKLFEERDKQFDAVLMNNTHEQAPMLPWDFEQLGPEEQAAAKQREPLLTKSLVDFVASGKGLVGIHGATAIRDHLKELAEMYGGQIMGHRGGVWWIKPDEPAHPLCAPLVGRNFEVRDEIYVFRKPMSREPMSREGVRVMLSLDLDKMEDPGLRADGDYAISWIRPYGKGRVFYCTLGHAKTAYTNPAVMRHYLAGIQFALGDLPADMSPRP